jgi:nucleoside-diphosphate-sugar epimerase
MIYPGGAFERQILEPLRKRRFFIPGPGENVLGVIAIRDVSDALVTAAEKGITGTYNWVDDQPLSWKELVGRVADTLGEPRPRSVPLPLVHLFKGRDLARYVSANLAVSNARAKAAGLSLSVPQFDLSAAQPASR